MSARDARGWQDRGTDEETLIRTLRFEALRERLRSSLWFLPSVGVVLAGVLAAVLSRVGLGKESTALSFGGSPEGARALVSTVAGSIITVTSVTFTLTVVALQVASSQFSPRILRTFLADRGNQLVLTTFLATFSFSLITLRSIRGGGQGEGDQPFVPDWAVGGTVVLTALSVAMLVYFIHHITQQLRVESVLEDLQAAALATARRHLPERDRDAEVDLPEVPDDAVSLRARSSGYLQTVDVRHLKAVAREEGIVIRLRPRLGSPVTKGATMAWAWPVGPGATIAADRIDAITNAVDGGVLVGFERTMQQDIAFGLRQMVDIAVRALSPGVNDPATAVATVGAIAPVLAELTSRRTGHVVELDDQGRTCVAIDEPTFSELLALSCDQPRRYATNEPAVLVAVLEMLADLAELDPPTPEALLAQVDLTVEVAEGRGLDQHDRRRIEVMAARARATLDVGDRVADDSEDDDVEEPAG